MDANLITQLGDRLHAALLARTPVEPLTSTWPDLDLADAYRIQEQMLSHRLIAGQAVIGKKVGATSRAVQERLGVNQPDFGLLLSGMLVPDGEPVQLDRLIQPLAEGEIAFILARDLQGPGVTAQDVLDATAWVLPCFEIVDSRIRDWQLRIQDTVADNASCGVFVLGDRLVDPRTLDLELAGMVITKNGQVACTGVGAAALGHPLAAMAWLANTLGALGIPLRAGELVLSGALGPLVPVAAGDTLHLTIDGIGTCQAHFAGATQ